MLGVIHVYRHRAWSGMVGSFKQLDARPTCCLLNASGVANPRLFAGFFAARCTQLRHHKIFSGDYSFNASSPGAFHSLYNIMIK